MKKEKKKGSKKISASLLGRAGPASQQRTARAADRIRRRPSYSPPTGGAVSA